MTEYFVKQFDGGSTACDGRNCACASGATAVAFGSGGIHTPSADQFRTKSGKSCVPGVDTNSGGLTIQAVEATAKLYGIDIDYGEVEGGVTRWTFATIKSRITKGEGAVLLGDYDQIPAEIDEQPGFNGDHSVFIHDGNATDVCWHDPLGDKPRRVKWSVAEKYNQKPGSPTQGLAGFVQIAQEADMTIYSVPGEREATFKAGTSYRDAPTGKVIGTLPVGGWYLLAGQDAPVAGWYLLDGAGLGPTGVMRWAPAAALEKTRDASWEAGRDAAIKAASAVKL
jgi:hypothetical protein